MRIRSKLVPSAVITFLLLLICAGTAMAQQPKSLVATVNGEGTIKLGKEKFPIHAVVVKLFEDGKAELNIITDITVFVSGTWERGPDTEKTIDFKITGGSASNLNGGGKLFLTDDRQSISALKLQVTNKLTNKVISADFVTK